MDNVLITSSAQLDTYFKTIQHEPLIAVDTEFFRETTYFAELGLVQIAGGEHVACVDVLAFDAREQLAQCLLNPAVGKIFHSCMQDLEVFYHYLGALPTPVLDTQIAAALLDEADQIGYANLVEKKLGVSLDKSQTRTNWLKRPLSKQQLDYAADDVRYLTPLYALLQQELDSTGRQAWFLQDCVELSASGKRFEPDFDYCWKRVRGTQRLSGQQLAIVDSIARWRETVAIENNLTRRRVLGDERVVQLVTAPPATEAALAESRPLPRAFAPHHLSDLYSAIQSGLNAAPETWPETRSNRPDAAQKTLLKQLQAMVNQKAETLGIAPSVLCSRKALEKLIAGERGLNILEGWRLTVLGDELLTALSSDQASVP
ncbi:MAG: ribonuclease D [Gammaproteobacteria bacterium]